MLGTVWAEIAPPWTDILPGKNLLLLAKNDDTDFLYLESRALIFIFGIWYILKIRYALQYKLPSTQNTPKLKLRNYIFKFRIKKKIFLFFKWIVNKLSIRLFYQCVINYWVKLKTWSLEVRCLSALSVNRARKKK